MTPADRLSNLQWALDNIYTLARRNLRRDPDAKDWGHVLRLCERAGCQERTVLRTVRTEAPDDPADRVVALEAALAAECQRRHHLIAAHNAELIVRYEERYAAERRAEEAEAALARADALLRECEWGGASASKEWCQVCKSYKAHGHADDCALAAYLRDREGGGA